MGSKLQVDWAGTHGTAHGTVNCLIAALSVPWVPYALAHTGVIPRVVLIPAGMVVTVLTMAAVLAWAAVRNARPGGRVITPATVLYQLVCITGSAAYGTWMLATPAWGWMWWVRHALILVAASILAGVIAGMVRDKPAVSVTEDEARRQAALEAGRLRDEHCEQWRQRILRISGGRVMVDVPALQTWKGRTPDGKPTGYTVELVCGSGGQSWRTIQQMAEQIEADLDLPPGCNAEVKMGVTRRAALVLVSTHNILAVEVPYPTDVTPLSINNVLPIGQQPDGVEVGPILRQHSMGIFGQKGSGKTNALHVAAAGIARCVDTLMWDIELTGGGLSRQWARTFLDGETSQPVVDWMALDEDEATLMGRAAERVNYRRKEIYQELMTAVDDDKLPVSADHPEIVIRHDEIARTMGDRSERPVLKAALIGLTFEARASAINTVYSGLEATSAVIDQNTLRQLGVVTCQRAGNDAAYAWAFGNWNHGLTTEAIPYPGNAGAMFGPGEPVTRMQWYRITPSRIKEICMATDGWHPTLDEPSRLAADGRNIDGTPMDDLLPGELDCYSTRWDRYRSANTTTPKKGTTVTSPSGNPNPGRPADVASAMARIDEAVARMQQAVAEAEAKLADDDVEATADWDAELRALLGSGQPSTGDTAPRRPAAGTDPKAVLLALIPVDGITVGDVIAQLRAAGVTQVRSTIHNWLSELIAAQVIEWRPDREGGTRGRYFRAGGSS